MHRYQKIVGLILTLSFLLVACGGGGDKPPVPMEKFDYIVASIKFE